MWGKLACGVSAAIITLNAAPAAATPVLLDPTYSGEMSIIAGNVGPNIAISGPGHFGNTVSCCVVGPGGTASGSVDLSIAPLPGIYASGAASADPGNDGGAGFVLNPILQYSLYILGPAGEVQVGVNANSSSSISGDAPGAVTETVQQTQFFVTGPGGGVIVDQSFVEQPNGLASYSGPTTGGFSDTGTYTFYTGEEYTGLLQIQLIGDISGAWGGGSLTETAYIDPQFFLPTGYTLLLSPGVGNGGTPVPAPPSFSLFVAGLGGLGLLGWRRKKKAAALATA